METQPYAIGHLTGREVSGRAFRALVFAFIVAAAPHSLAQPMTFTHLAGWSGGFDWEDGSGGASHFERPAGVAVDGAGNLYVSEFNKVRKVTPGGDVTTLAGRPEGYGSDDGMGSVARFWGTTGVAVDHAGNVYVGDSFNHTIRKVSRIGVVTTLAGLAGRVGGTDAVGSEARFNFPTGVAVDGDGNVYVADQRNHTIRKVTRGAVVTTLAGLPGIGGSADGIGSGARFSSPGGVAVDRSGNIFVADTGNHTIRMVTAAGEVTTLAGFAGSGGRSDGSGSEARFFYPNGVAVDGTGNVFVADTNNSAIRKVTPAGVVTTVAGLPGIRGGTDGTGSGARFYLPKGIAVDPSGSLYVADHDVYEAENNHTIRKVTPAGEVTTLAGLAGPATDGSADGMGSTARFQGAASVAVDGSGNVYVADTRNNSIRRVTRTGEVTTVAGGGWGSADGAASEAQFNGPMGVAVSGSGNVFVADTGNNVIRQVTPEGRVTTLAGLAGTFGRSDGSGSSARFWQPRDVAVDGSGNVFVADTLNNVIRKVTPEGVVTTLAGGDAGSSDGGIGSVARFLHPSSVAVDGAGTIYVADTGNSTVRRVTQAGEVTTIAGLAGSTGSVDGSGRAARFNSPEGVGTDGAGNVYVADSKNYTIRKLSPAGEVTTLAGTALSPADADGTGTQARFLGPTGVALDGSGNVFVADGPNIKVGRASIPDIATVDSASGPVGRARQLDTTPRTASAWNWQIIRRPSASSALLSSSSTRNPTFVPDIADAFIFRLTATDSTGGQSVSYLELSAFEIPCVPDASTLCLLDGRFVVRADWKDYGGNSGPGHAVSLTSDTGYFWFFDARNVETVVKMVSFCGIGSDNVSVYAAGLTDVGVTIHVTDTRTGATRDYRNPLGRPFELVRDGPFGCPAGFAGDLPQGPEAPAAARPVGRGTAGGTRTGEPSAPTTCSSDSTTLCLLGGRYQVRAAFRDYSGRSGTGQAVPLTADTGTFWFFDSKNVEVLAKMVSFCGGGSDTVSVYAGGLTDVEVTLTATDTLTGTTKEYRNPLGSPFQLIRDGPFSCP